MITVYETKRSGSKRGYLVATADKNKLITALTKAQFIRNRLLSIVEKPYIGKKYSNCVWIIEG